MMCERIALIQSGKILSIDTPDNIIAQFPVPLYAAKARDTYKLLTALRKHPEIASSFAFGDSIHITLKDNSQGIAALERSLAAEGHREFEINRTEPTIEDSFIQLMSNT
jgi:ABC-type multidrug transport system ATPase subunit